MGVIRRRFGGRWVAGRDCEWWSCSGPERVSSCLGFRVWFDLSRLAVGCAFGVVRVGGCESGIVDPALWRDGRLQ